MAETTSRRVTQVVNSQGEVKRIYVSDFASKSSRSSSDVARSAIHIPILTFVVIILAIFVLRFLLQGRPTPYYPLDTGNVESDFQDYRNSGFLGRDYPILSNFKDLVDNVPDLTIKFGFNSAAWGDWGVFNWLRNGLYNIFGGLVSIVNIWISFFSFCFTFWNLVLGTGFGALNG